MIIIVIDSLPLFDVIFFRQIQEKKATCFLYAKFLHRFIDFHRSSWQYKK